MLMSPWRQRVTAFDLCTPAWAKPSVASARSKRAAAVSSMANSTKSIPRQCARGGRFGMPAIGVPVRRCNSSSMNMSERWPSTATERAEPARKLSLNISSESSPSKPVAWSASMNGATGSSPWLGKQR